MDFSSREVDLGPRTSPLAQKIVTLKSQCYPTPPMGNSYLSFAPMTDRGLGNTGVGVCVWRGKEGE